MINLKLSQATSLPIFVSTVSSNSLETLRLRLAFSAAGRLCALGLAVSQIVGQVRPSKIRRFNRKF